MTSLPEKMREAAETIRKFNERQGYPYPDDIGWTPEALCREAGHVETEEREAFEREQLVAQLAMDIFNLRELGLRGRDLSRDLIKLGWHK